MFSSTELFLSHPKFQQGLNLIMDALAALQTAAPAIDSDAYSQQLEQIGQLRGRPLFFPYLGSGIGKGAKVRTADGRWLLDFAIGIGVHFFGHSHPDLVRTAVAAAASDTVMQGNLQANAEYGALLQILLAHSAPQLAHGWLSLPGTEANENALKLIRYHRQPARDLIAFRRCFHGRTTTMAEITDRPDYRKGQPTRERVFYLPFYEPDDPESTQKTLTALREVLDHHPGEIAACLFELVQGEAGFRTAPREFFAPLMELLRERGVTIWVDEVQTFGRTGELFAFQRLELAAYVDVVTIGKLLQNSAVLFREEYLPDPSLISGTFAGTTVGLAVGRRIVEKLTQENYLGPDGHIAKLERQVRDGLARLQRETPQTIRSFDGIGAMWSVEPMPASYHDIKALLHECYRNGLILYYSGFGEGPYRLRIFLPGGVVTTDELNEGLDILRFSLKQLCS
ncbi:MAG TPA: aminotransferase class III-fold pyridoxal phosphate-dependent enzyme [Methylomirabilota bacterium]|nr:aminotransferase class III-fold pyridoxal phosphate-dependent enzyme [Methylomirabilota bacterium]